MKLSRYFFLILFSLMIFLTKNASYAQAPTSGKFGLGVILGAPTAITGKYWNTKNTAIDFGISFSSGYYFLIYGDYLWHYPGFLGHSSRFVNQLNPYVGVGGGFYNWASGYYYGDRPNGWRYYNGSVGLYARVPFGIEWNPSHPSLGVFVELAPGMAIIPGFGVTIDAGIGARYYF